METYTNKDGALVKTTTIDEVVDLDALKNEKAGLENQIAENEAANKIAGARVEEISKLFKVANCKV